LQVLQKTTFKHRHSFRILDQLPLATSFYHSVGSLGFSQGKIEPPPMMRRLKVVMKTAAIVQMIAVHKFCG
jgi:hypothetical protein